MRVEPVKMERVGSLYVPEGEHRVVRLIEPRNGCEYALLRICEPAPVGDGTYLVTPEMVLCLLPTPW